MPPSSGKPEASFVIFKLPLLFAKPIIHKEMPILHGLSAKCTDHTVSLALLRKVSSFIQFFFAVSES